ncbi:MAG: hypothetical protein GXO32_05230 [Crenarchaeota archaeon]|nr:hypothetical protein [Thermoproteota archaeon]
MSSPKIVTFGVVQYPPATGPKLYYDVSLTTSIDIPVRIFVANNTKESIWVEVVSNSKNYTLSPSRLGEVKPGETLNKTINVSRTSLPSTFPTTEEVVLEVRAYKDSSYSELLASAYIDIDVVYIKRPSNATVFDFSSSSQIASGEGKLSSAHYISPPYAVCKILAKSEFGTLNWSGTLLCVKTGLKSAEKVYVSIPIMFYPNDNMLTYGRPEIGIRIWEKSSSGSKTLMYISDKELTPYIVWRRWLVIVIIAELDADSELCIDIDVHTQPCGVYRELDICVDDLAIWPA